MAIVGGTIPPLPLAKGHRAPRRARKRTATNADYASDRAISKEQNVTVIMSANPARFWRSIQALTKQPGLKDGQQG